MHAAAKLFAEVLFFSTAAVGMAAAQKGTVVATGTFHAAAHPTSGRATVYQTGDAETLRLTKFKTSNGPDVHVVLIAATDVQNGEEFFDKGIEKIELGLLKGNEGDQSYAIPAGTDLDKFKTVSIYCVRFNANFGAAKLEK